MKDLILNWLGVSILDESKCAMKNLNEAAQYYKRDVINYNRNFESRCDIYIEENLKYAIKSAFDNEIYSNNLNNLNNKKLLKHRISGIFDRIVNREIIGIISNLVECELKLRLDDQDFIDEIVAKINKSQLIKS